jgi:hypothetical protein
MSVGATDSASLYLSAFAYSSTVTGNTRTVSVTELDVGIEATGPGAASFISAVQAALDKELGIDTTASSRAGAASATADGSARALGRGGEPPFASSDFAQSVADFVAALVGALKAGDGNSSFSPALPGAAYAGAGTDVGSALKRLIDAPAGGSAGSAVPTATADLERAFSRLLSSIAPPATAESKSVQAATADGAPTLGSFLAALARQLQQTPAGLGGPGGVFRSVA